ncbi:unnamed protein product [Amoebophrya sp. A120]|nr:unnamed protein product [Amoebophrya sp. A120]|eukprot:GSA120T00013071001.1
MALAPESVSLTADDYRQTYAIFQKDREGGYPSDRHRLADHRDYIGVSILPRVIQTHQDVKSLRAAMANLSTVIDPSAVSVKLQETAVNAETTALRIGGLEAGLGSVAEAATVGSQLVEKLNKLEAKIDAIQAEVKETKAQVVAQGDKEMCRCVIM